MTYLAAIQAGAYYNIQVHDLTITLSQCLSSSSRADPMIFPHNYYTSWKKIMTSIRSNDSKTPRFKHIVSRTRLNFKVLVAMKFGEFCEVWGPTLPTINCPSLSTVFELEIRIGRKAQILRLKDNNVDCVFSVARLKYFNQVMASVPVTELKLGICISGPLSPQLSCLHTTHLLK